MMEEAVRAENRELGESALSAGKSRVEPKGMERSEMIASVTRASLGDLEYRGPSSVASRTLEVRVRVRAVDLEERVGDYERATGNKDRELGERR